MIRHNLTVRQSRCKWSPALLFLLLAGLSSTQASGQRSPIEVELSAGIGAPGRVVVLPLLLHLGGDVEVRKLEIEVDLPAGRFELKAVRPGKALEQAGGGLEHSTGEPAAEKLPLRLTVRGPGPLPAGELARLILEIGRDTPEQSYTLAVKAQSPALKADTLDGILVVDQNAASPVFGCFFYMH